MMTLQQTIDHHKRIFDSYQHTAPECDTAREHLQLANWLEELSNARKNIGLPDFPRDTAATLRYVKSAVRRIRENGYRGQFFVYMLVRDDIPDAEFRLRQLVNLKVTPFAQPYRDFTNKAQTSREQRDFARFANLKGGKLCLKMKFSEYYHR